VSALLGLPDDPLLDLRTLELELPRALGELPSPVWLRDLLAPGVETPLARDEEGRRAVRDLLRRGGHRPTGRGKPSSEYLARAAADGRLGSINLAVDLGNAVSLASGIPISVVDRARLVGELRVGVAGEDDEYVFNASGQVLRLRGLLSLFDAHGPCANAVKDAQRTRTRAETRRTLSILWAPRALGDGTERALDWYAGLARRAGLRVATP
jgi:DNA/RNA-binding domain of Phe-tRNA-synthetase-like protein